jgi:hypothetical protein
MCMVKYKFIKAGDRKGDISHKDTVKLYETNRI